MLRILGRANRYFRLVSETAARMRRQTYLRSSLEMLEVRTLLATFQGLGAPANLPGATSSAFADVNAISADGTTVVGEVQDDPNGLGAFWNTTNGSIQFVTSPADFSWPFGVSNDGSVLSIGGPGQSPYRWTKQSDQLQPIPLLQSQLGSDLYVSGDGTTFTAFEGSYGVLRWTAAGGTSLIIPGTSYEQSGVTYSVGGVTYDGIVDVVGVSSDGTVVGGSLFSPDSGTELFQWDNGNLSTLQGGQNYFYDPDTLSPDGSVLVGLETTYLSSIQGFQYQDFLWGPNGVTNFGPAYTEAPATYDLPSQPYFVPFATSNSATTIVGEQTGFVSSGQQETTTEAAIWDATNGLRNLQAVLVADGLGSALTGWNLTQATAITPDGNTIAGVGIDPQGLEEPWVAHLNVTDQWTGANYKVDTNWSDGANWSLGTPPTSGQTALFTNNSTVKDFTATVDAGFTNSIAGLDSNWSGTINVKSPLTVTGNYNMASGTLGGKGAVSIAGTGQWTGGQINLGSGGFTNSGTLTVDTTNGNLALVGTGTLTNNGTLTEEGTNALQLESGAKLYNAVGATFDFTKDSNVSQSGGGTFTNAGTLEKTGGSATSTITSSFVNSGANAAINVQTATLVLASAGGVSTGGTFTVSPGATLDLTGGVTATYKGTYTGTGAGTVALLGGTLAVASGGASFNMSGSLFEWTGGTIDVTKGKFTNTGTINYSGTGNVVLNGAGSLLNKNSILQSSTGTLVLQNGATLNNTSGANYIIENNGSISQSGSGTLTNAGTLAITSGNGVSSVSTNTLDNTGTVQVFGTLDISATISQVSGSTLTAGTWTVIGLPLSPSTLDFTSTGSLTTIGGKAHVNLSGGISYFTNINSVSTVQNGGTFSVSGETFTTGGNLTNAGSLVLTSSGTVNVSGNLSNTGSLNLSNSTLTVTGSVTQLSGTSLTAGSWTVGTNSSLDFAAGSNITTITGAKVTLDGANSNFAAQANLAKIGGNGSLILQGGQNFTTTGSFTDNGTLTVGPGSIFTVTGSFTQSSTGTLALEIGGTAAAPTFGQIISTTATVTLAGALQVTSTVIPTVGSTFELLANMANAVISGAFSGIAEGSTFTVTSGSTTMTFQISYVGNGGNNVVITRIS